MLAEEDRRFQEIYRRNRSLAAAARRSEEQKPASPSAVPATQVGGAVDQAAAEAPPEPGQPPQPFDSGGEGCWPSGGTSTGAELLAFAQTLSKLSGPAGPTDG